MLRIGTCSWKYDSWKGILYPNTEKFNFLEEYSKYYNTVEVDQWFWSLFDNGKVILPKENDAKSYAESVPVDFKFTIKIPNSLTLTHFYRKNKIEALKPNPHFLSSKLFEKFLETLKPLNKKIGVLIFQFEYLNKQKLSGLSEFIDRFGRFFESVDKDFNYGIELRNPNYLKQPFFDYLIRNNLAMVFLQGYYMQPIWEIFNEYRDKIRSTTVIRLHGPDRKSIEEKSGSEWNQIIEPKDDELDKIVEIINYLSNKKIDIYLNVNNHYEGSAPLTIQKINKLINKKAPDVP